MKAIQNSENNKNPKLKALNKIKVENNNTYYFKWVITHSKELSWGAYPTASLVQVSEQEAKQALYGLELALPSGK